MSEYIKRVFLTFILVHGSAHAETITEEYELQKSKLTSIYKSDEKALVLRLHTPDGRDVTQTISFSRRPHAALRKIVLPSAKVAVLVELNVTNVRVVVVMFHQSANGPDGFESIRQQSYSLIGDRGDFTFYAGHLILTLGYPGSLNVINIDDMRLIGSSKILDWPQQVMACADAIYVGPLYVSATRNKLGKIAVSSLQDFLAKLSQASIHFQSVDLTPGSVFQSMERDENTLKVFSQIPNGSQGVTNLKCSDSSDQPLF